MKAYLLSLTTSLVYAKDGDGELPDGNIHNVGTDTSIVWMGCSTRVTKSTTLSSQSVMKFDIGYPSGYVCCIIMFQGIGELITDSTVPLRFHRSSTSIGSSM